MLPVNFSGPARRAPGIFISAAVFLFLSNVAMADLLPPAEILQELKDFRETGSVLYVAAQPDDENTVLLTCLARGRHDRTASLSLTRGEDGENAPGPESGAELGVIRTQELLAARRLDGARQFFTRARDFGFSKDYRETLRIWDREQVVSDIARVIREFRPDVVITRDSPQPGDPDGQHTASAMLALEAFKLAGDPKAFPEQQLPPWQPKRILQNDNDFGGGGTNSAGAVRVDVSGNDPVSGESFSAMAARSRSMRQTQDFGNSSGGGARTESFTLLAGEPATRDILDGVDQTWARFPGGAEIGRMADEIISQFNPQNPAASVAALLALRKNLAALTGNPLLDEKRRQLDRILQACLGLSIETTVARAEVVPGETMKLRHTATVSSEIPVRWTAVRYPSIGGEMTNSVELSTNATATMESRQTLPADAPLSQPCWLRAEGTTGMFRVDDAKLIGCPENPPAFPVKFVFETGGQTLVISDEPVQAGSAQGEFRRRLEVIPPVSLQFDHEVELFQPGMMKNVSGEVTAARGDLNGTVELEMPAGWKFEPANIPFHLAQPGQAFKFSFSIFAPMESATAPITARANVGDASYDNRRVEINYRHIPPLLLQPPARFKAVSLNLATRGHRIGYLPGAGDNVADALTQMGCAVTPLTGDDLTTNRLKDFDAVVIGVCAFNVRNDLAAHLPELFAYVEAGGTVVAQYNRPDGLKAGRLAPFDLHLSDQRVTDETAPVTFLAPDHPALNSPNKITGADFDGWIQERGIYFPSRWDGHFTPILACGDPGEPPLKGGLLVAKYGKGNFVYTGLGFFRELPAGVPGAYRLFANLVSLGK